MSKAAPDPQSNMGKPEPRLDGRLKVTGEARYGSDFVGSNPAYAFLVTSPIAKGRIESMDLQAAKAVPGVIEIFNYENTGELKDIKYAKAAAGRLLDPELRSTDPVRRADRRHGRRRYIRGGTGSCSYGSRELHIRATKRYFRVSPKAPPTKDFRKPVTPNRLLPLPMFGLRPNTKRRPNTTIQSNCLRRHASGATTTS